MIIITIEGLEAILTEKGGTNIRVYKVETEEKAVELCTQQPKASTLDTYEVMAIYGTSFYARFYGNHPFGLDILPDRLVWKDEEVFRGDNPNAISPYYEGFAVCKIPFETNLYRAFFPDDFDVIKWVEIMEDEEQYGNEEFDPDDDWWNQELSDI
jgi:hypothetical protein